LIKEKQANDEAKISSIYLNFFITYIKKDNQRDFFYYKTKGFGENGTWFRFGIPDSQQI